MRVCPVAQSCPALCDPWTVACQVLLSIGLPRQEYWRPLPPPGALSDPGIEPMSPALAGRFFTTEPPGKLRGIMSFSFLYVFVALHSKFSPMGLYLFCNWGGKKKGFKKEPQEGIPLIILFILLIYLAKFLFIVRLAGTHKFHTCDDLN